MITKPPKPKKCKQCKIKFIPSKPLQHVCGFDCAVAYTLALKEKNNRLQAQEMRREHKAAKQKIKTRAEWLKEAQTVFNRYIRMRDAKDPCISCGRHHEGQYHAGHYRTVGASPELRFNELNCHKQCSACNNHLSGNIVNYRIRLLAKIGHKNLEFLEGTNEPLKLSIDDIKAIKAHYTARCKALIKLKGE